MGEKMNGGSRVDEELPSIDVGLTGTGAVASLTPKQAVELVDQQIALPMGVIVRGLLASAAGIPPNILLPAIARQCGRLLAMSVYGNSIEAAMQARADFKKAFEDGIKKIPVIPPAGQVPTNGIVKG